jgi:hypothetical protein
MSSCIPTTARLIIVLLLAEIALGGCSVLERPARLSSSSTDRQTQRRMDDAAAGVARRYNTVVIPGDGDPPFNQAPYTTSIQGGASDPFAHGPQGVLPSPGRPDQ